jgi:hypothetical protein
VRFDDAVQHAAFGVARLIRGARERHARDIGRADGRGQCRKRDTSKGVGVAALTHPTGRVSTSKLAVHESQLSVQGSAADARLQEMVAARQ